MNLRSRAVLVMARTRIKETVIQPGFYIASALGLVAAFGLQQAFALSVGSGGFEPALNPIYDFINRFLSGMFGETYTEQLFAGGPYLFALVVSFAPVYLYVVISSLFRTGMEKQVGALELITSGPADGISCYLSALLRDFVAALVYLVALLAAFLLGALLNNLAITPRVFLAFLQALFVSILFFSYAVLLGASTNGPIAGLTSHIGLSALFALAFVARYALVGGAVRSVVAAIAVVVEWLSPLHYWKMGSDAAAMRQWPVVLVSLLALSALSALVIFASAAILRKRGVRA